MSTSGFAPPTDPTVASLCPSLSSAELESYTTMATSLAAAAFINPLTGVVRPGSLTHILKLLPPNNVNASTTAAADTADVALINADAALNTFNNAVNKVLKPTRLRPPPPSRFYSPELDLSAFNVTVPLLSLRVPARSTSALVNALRAANLGCQIPQIKHVVADAPHCPNTHPASAADKDDQQGSQAFRRVLLSTDITDYASLERALTAPGAQHTVNVQGVAPGPIKAVLASLGCTVAPYRLTLGYESFSTDNILTALLPPHTPIPQSYSLIGHIAHVNLRDEQLPYKHVIGRVILSKSYTLRTVVNKVGAIDNVYRNFQAEVLAAKSARSHAGAAGKSGDAESDFYYFKGSGDAKGSIVAVVASDGNNSSSDSGVTDAAGAAAASAAGEGRYGYDGSLMTVVYEHGTEFEFDFGEVYWNSRLQTEHRRVVQIMTAQGERQRNGSAASNSTTDCDLKKAASETGAKPAAKKVGGVTIKPPSASALNASRAPVSFVLDPFAGVGPFAVPAAQSGCEVWASDLNPKSALYLYRYDHISLAHIPQIITNLNLSKSHFLFYLNFNCSSFVSLVFFLT